MPLGILRAGLALSHHRCGKRQKIVMISMNDNIPEKVQLSPESEGTVELSCLGSLALSPAPAVRSPRVVDNLQSWPPQ